METPTCVPYQVADGPSATAKALATFEGTPSPPLKSVTAVELVRRMRGGSQPFMMLCNDGHYYIVKTLGNPQCDEVLGAEYLATFVMRAMGLPVPPVAKVLISQRFLERNCEMKFELNHQWIGPRRPLAGIQFGSRLVGSPQLLSYTADYIPSGEFGRVLNRRDFVGTLVFDVWASNQDHRQAIFSGPSPTGRLRVQFIDHGYTFGSTTDGHITFGDRRGTYARHSVYYGLIESSKCFSPWVDRLRNVAPGALKEALDTVPRRWYGFDKAKIYDQLVRKLEGIDLLLEQYRIFLLPTEFSKPENDRRPPNPISRRRDFGLPLRA